MKNIFNISLEFFVVLTLTTISFYAYLLVKNPGIFPAIEINISYYYFLNSQNKKSYLYLLLLDILQGNIIALNICTYCIVSNVIRYILVRYYHGDAAKFVNVLIFTFLFLLVQYLLISLYEQRLFNYLDILWHILTTSLLYPFIEQILRVIKKEYS